MPGFKPAWRTAAVTLPWREGCAGPSTWCIGKEGRVRIAVLLVGGVCGRPTTFVASSAHGPSG
eukprot:446809-Amphidinium_carterae.1